MKQAIITSTTKSLDNICQRLMLDAPNTLRIPNSLVRCSAVNEAIPKSPRQLMNTERTEKAVERLPMRTSLLNLIAYCSSTNLYSNGHAGANSVRAVCIVQRCLGILL